MGKYQNKAYSLRISDELKEKVKEIARRGNRPASYEYQTIIQNYVDQYEKEHGVIILNDPPEMEGGGNNT